jgi:hypothetical protein
MAGAFKHGPGCSCCGGPTSPEITCVECYYLNFTGWTLTNPDGATCTMTAGNGPPFTAGVFRYCCIDQADLTGYERDEVPPVFRSYGPADYGLYYSVSCETVDSAWTGKFRLRIVGAAHTDSGTEYFPLLRQRFSAGDAWTNWVCPYAGIVPSYKVYCDVTSDETFYTSAQCTAGTVLTFQVSSTVLFGGSGTVTVAV